MLSRLSKILLAVFLSLIFTVTLSKLVLCIYHNLFNENHSQDNVKVYDVKDDVHSGGGSSGGQDVGGEVENWLEENQLGQYKKLFRDKGKFGSFKKFCCDIIKLNFMFLALHYIYEHKLEQTCAHFMLHPF